MNPFNEDAMLSDLLNGRRPLDRKALRFLRRAVDQHPYSQPLHALYAKALMANGKSGLGKADARALLCAPNRRLYREFMHRALEDGHLPVKGDTGGDEKGLSPGRDHGDQRALIDRFLEASPRIGQLKSGVPDGDLSRESIEDHPELASETLAEVLVKQGKTEQAKQMYKKLSLMFPEKSSYFAKKFESI